MLFSQVIGQEQIKERLRMAVREGRIPHAQLFSGECGVGVLPLALAYAQYVACPNRTDTDACGKCPTCQKYEKLAHPDLHLVFPIVKKEKSEVCDTYMTKFSSFISKNPYANLFQWLSELGREEKNALIATNESEEIVKKMSLKSYEGGVKTMIVWMPEKMHLACSNKLLKLIEEPYPNTVIILVSYDPSQIIATIRSRTQLVMVPPISDADLSDYLKKTKQDVTDDTLTYALKVAQGNYSKALETIDGSERSAKFLELFIDVMRKSYGIRNLFTLQKKGDFLIDFYNEGAEKFVRFSREEQIAFCRYAQNMIRENFIMNLHEEELNYLREEERAFCVRFSPFVNEENVWQIVQELGLMEQHLRQNAQSRLVFVDFMLKMIMVMKPKK